MLLGTRAPVPGKWRFVEADLHDICDRVREYDADARLVRDDETGDLGLVRRVDGPLKAFGYEWLLARRLEDPTSDAPLRGEPDGRVIQVMRYSDMRRLRSLDEWNRTEASGMRIQLDRERAQMRDKSRELAKDAAWHARRKDLGHQDFAFIG